MYLCCAIIFIECIYFSSTRYSRSDCDDGDSRFSFSSSSSPRLQVNKSSIHISKNIFKLKNFHQSLNGCDIEIEEDCKSTLNDLTKCSDDDLAESTTNSYPASNGNGSLGVHVLSASGNNIIAVANPALALNSTMIDSVNIKREDISAED